MARNGQRPDRMRLAAMHAECRGCETLGERRQWTAGDHEVRGFAV